MTLEEFLAREQEFAESVQVDHGDGKLQMEHHAIPPEALPIMRQVWTMQYYEWNRLQAWKDKETELVHKRGRSRAMHASR